MEFLILKSYALYYNIFANNDTSIFNLQRVFHFSSVFMMVDQTRYYEIFMQNVGKFTNKTCVHYLKSKISFLLSFYCPSAFLICDIFFEDGIHRHVCFIMSLKCLPYVSCCSTSWLHSVAAVVRFPEQQFMLQSSACVVISKN